MSLLLVILEGLYRVQGFRGLGLRVKIGFRVLGVSGFRISIVIGCFKLLSLAENNVQRFRGLGLA